MDNSESMRSRNPRFDPDELELDDRLKQSRRNQFDNSRESSENDNNSPGLIPMPKKWSHKENKTPISKKNKQK